MIINCRQIHKYIEFHHQMDNIRHFVCLVNYLNVNLTGRRDINKKR